MIELTVFVIVHLWHRTWFSFEWFKRYLMTKCMWWFPCCVHLLKEPHWVCGKRIFILDLGLLRLDYLFWLGTYKLFLHILFSYILLFLIRIIGCPCDRTLRLIYQVLLWHHWTLILLLIKPIKIKNMRPSILSYWGGDNYFHRLTSLQ